MNVFTGLTAMAAAFRAARASDDFENKIVNGVQSPPVPWFVQLYDIGTATTFCGGQLVAHDVVLTAAHCVSEEFAPIPEVDPSEILALVGGNRANLDGNGEVRQVLSDFVIHPDWNGWANIFEGNDYAMFRIERPTDPAVIKLNSDSSIPKNGEYLTVLGYGWLDSVTQIGSDELLKVDLRAVEPDRCLEIWQDLMPVDVYSFYTEWDDTILCAKDFSRDVGACKGDSGGPLITQSGALVGIVSFGNAANCGYSQVPDGFARVSEKITWIRQQICKLSAYPPGYCANPCLAKVKRECPCGHYRKGSKCFVRVSNGCDTSKKLKNYVRNKYRRQYCRPGRIRK